jgi:hypothetical protein
MEIQWKKGWPHPWRGVRYLLLCGAPERPLVITGAYRDGHAGEGEKDKVYWRADCCGRRIWGVMAWAEMPKLAKILEERDADQTD